jgi:hypothetical protein
MTRHRLEVADVVREHGEEYLARYGGTTAQRQVLRAVQNCRTAALGGHVEVCDRCGHQRVAYNSCRNRHCPKCQGPACARWMQARATELLPVPYFHLVFTLPNSLAPLALQNQCVVYGLLFQAAAQTLLEVAANPRFIGAEIGFLTVLHTWGQNLQHHPHVHCVVPGGGLSAEGDRWIAARPGFFLPVRVLSRVFRGKFIEGLKRAWEHKRLEFHGGLAGLAETANFQQLVDQAVRHDWVVYSKRPFGGPEQVLKYLARYTHRVAISNQRLIGLSDGQVTFHWKDYARHGRSHRMTIGALEFLRRFLLHVLPLGFMKIRHYGFMANRFRAAKLARARELLHASLGNEAPVSADSSSTSESNSRGHVCPRCQQGRLQIMLRLLPYLGRSQPTIVIQGINSS